MTPTWIHVLQPLSFTVVALSVALALSQARAKAPEPKKAAPADARPDTSACVTAECCPAGMPQILGSNAADALGGGPAGECIVGLDSGDTLDGKSGGDVVIGGAGPDLLLGRSFDDRMFGGLGMDQIFPDSGDDQAWGGEDDDLIHDVSGSNLLGGGAGNDRIRGGAHGDAVWGNLGDDEIDGHAGDDLIYPGPGRDDVDAGPGNDTIVILALCEIEPGEILRGGPGFDRLKTPLTQQQLTDLGVIIESIEEIELTGPNTDFGPGSCFFNQAGEVVCECCDQGTIENQCGSCAEGYHLEGPNGLPGTTDGPGGALDVDIESLVCVPDETCAGVDCGPNGNCTTADGVRTCVCNAGYTGALCDACAAPFEEVLPGLCVLGEDCARSLCNGHGSCELGPQTREVSCDCDAGFAAPNCGPPDLGIAELTKPVVAGQATTLSAQLAPGVSCDGDFEWELVEGNGTLEPSDDTTEATYTPDALGPGELTEVHVVRVTCASAPALSFEIGFNAVSQDGLVINGTARPELEALDQAMLAYLDASGLPGATLAVTKDDQLVFLRGYGWSDQLMTETMATCAPMRIASLVKPFTQAAIVSLYGSMVDGATFGEDTRIFDHFLDLVGIELQNGVRVPSFIVPQGEYDLDNWPTWCFVPEFEEADVRWVLVTVGNLLGHQGGILSNDNEQQPGLFDPQLADLAVANLMDLDDAPPTVLDRLRFLGGACFIDWPGAFHYSNVGYNLLGRIVADVSGTGSWWDYMRDSVLAPVGIVAGTDPDTTDLIYLGRSLAPDVQPEEPYYFTDFSDRGNVITPFKEDGEWMAGADVPAPYGSFHLEAFDSHGGLVSKVETLTEFMKFYKISSGDMRTLGEFPRGGMGSHFGRLIGTHSFFWQLPHSEKVDDMGMVEIVPIEFRVAGSADDIDDLDTVEVELPPGVTLAVLFNKEDLTDSQPSFMSGKHDVTLLKDRLGIAVSQVTMWPAPLTQAEKDFGCVNPLPPQEGCGNGDIDPGEDCDGGPGAFACENLGFAGGMLECTDQCQFDTSGCFEVPDNEFCDPDADEPGDCPGSLCAEIDLSADPLDPFSAFRGDGNSDGLHYCRDDTGFGRMVCIEEDNEAGICKVCGEFEEAGLSTNVGCPCVFDEGANGCQNPGVPGSSNLVCFGGQAGEQNAGWDNANVDTAPGYCYDNDEGPPSFQCLANCPLLGWEVTNQGPFYCYTGDPQDPFGPKGVCVSFFCTGWNNREQAEECSSMGGVCDENGNQTCVAQCSVGEPTSCQDVGFPNTWVCQTQGAFGGECVFP